MRARVHVRWSRYSGTAHGYTLRSLGSPYRARSGRNDCDCPEVGAPGAAGTDELAIARNARGRTGQKGAEEKGKENTGEPPSPPAPGLPLCGWCPHALQTVAAQTATHTTTLCPVIAHLISEELTTTQNEGTRQSGAVVPGAVDSDEEDMRRRTDIEYPPVQMWDRSLACHRHHCLAKDHVIKCTSKSSNDQAGTGA